MLGSLKPILFLACTDRDKARAFYEGTLGLRHVLDDGFAHIFEVASGMLRIVQADDFQPQSFTVLGWETSDVAALMGELAGRGVVFEKYPFADPETGIWTIGTNQVAWFKDPFGNVLSISSHGSD